MKNASTFASKEILEIIELYLHSEDLVAKMKTTNYAGFLENLTRRQLTLLADAFLLESDALVIEILQGYADKWGEPK